MESSTQPSCFSSKTPSGSSLLIMKASSTCLVRPSQTTFTFQHPLCLYLFILTFLFFGQTEKYFDMKKTQCKEGLDIYKKFLTRMTRISEFLKVAEVPYADFFTDNTTVMNDVSLMVLQLLDCNLVFLSCLNSRWALIEETFQTFHR